LTATPEWRYCRRYPPPPYSAPNTRPPSRSVAWPARRLSRRFGRSALPRGTQQTVEVAGPPHADTRGPSRIDRSVHAAYHATIMWSQPFLPRCARPTRGVAVCYLLVVTSGCFAVGMRQVGDGWEPVDRQVQIGLQVPLMIPSERRVWPELSVFRSDDSVGVHSGEVDELSFGLCVGRWAERIPFRAGHVFGCGLSYVRSELWRDELGPPLTDEGAGVYIYYLFHWMVRDGIMGLEVRFFLGPEDTFGETNSTPGGIQLMLWGFGA